MHGNAWIQLVINLTLGRLEWYVYDVSYYRGADNFTTGETYNDGQWHHVLCTIDTSVAPNKLKFYVDDADRTGCKRPLY